MAIDIERILNKLVDMAEQKQKAQGINSYWGGTTSNASRAYDDSQTKAKWDAIDKKDALRDTNATHLQVAQLANPASSLDAAGRAAYANAAVSKMDAEAKHNLGMGAQGQGEGAYRQSLANKNEQEGKVFASFTPQEQSNAMRGFALPPTATANSRYPTTIPKNDTLAALNPVTYSNNTVPAKSITTSLPSITSSAPQQRAPEKSFLQDYTEGYNNFSNSIAGQMAGLPGTNNLIQNGLVAGQQIGSGISSLNDWLTKPRKNLVY